MRNVADHLRKAADKRDDDALRLQAATAGLAQALCHVVARSLDPGDTAGSESLDASAFRQVLDDWAADCGELLHVISSVLADLTDVALGKEGTAANGPPLATAAEGLLQQTRAGNERLKQSAKSLRNELSTFMERLSEAGTQEQMLQKEQRKHRQRIERADALEAELEQLKAEQRPLIEKIEGLQRTISMARATASERKELEDQVQDAEQQLREQEREVRELESEQSVLQEKLTSLPERRDRTIQLIEQLRNSPQKKLFNEIQRIWQRLPVNLADQPPPMDQT